MQDSQFPRKNLLTIQIFSFYSVIYDFIINLLKSKRWERYVLTLLTLHCKMLKFFLFFTFLNSSLRWKKSSQTKQTKFHSHEYYSCRYFMHYCGFIILVRIEVINNTILKSLILLQIQDAIIEIHGTKFTVFKKNAISQIENIISCIISEF